MKTLKVLFVFVLGFAISSPVFAKGVCSELVQVVNSKQVCLKDGNGIVKNTVDPKFTSAILGCKGVYDSHSEIVINKSSELEAAWAAAQTAGSASLVAVDKGDAGEAKKVTAEERTAFNNASNAAEPCVESGSKVNAIFALRSDLKNRLITEACGQNAVIELDSLGAPKGSAVTETAIKNKIDTCKERLANIPEMKASLGTKLATLGAIAGGGALLGGIVANALSDDDADPGKTKSVSELAKEECDKDKEKYKWRNGKCILRTAENENKCIEGQIDDGTGNCVRDNVTPKPTTVVDTGSNGGRGNVTLGTAESKTEEEALASLESAGSGSGTGAGSGAGAGAGTGTGAGAGASGAALGAGGSSNRKPASTGAATATSAGMGSGFGGGSLGSDEEKAGGAQVEYKLLRWRNSAPKKSLRDR